MKIATPVQWANAMRAGVFAGTESDTAGFIHLSSLAQVARTANKWYAGRRGLVLLAISPSKLRADLRWEPTTQGELFPHAYGPINLDAVVSVIPFEPLEDGTFVTPSCKDYDPKDPSARPF
ncbi:MAG TPA: DUF952 domain-containing protein [bacterium]|nr:DUF952 domain-containing protein [bacterium]